MSATGLTRKVLLVDGNNILVRSVFAMRHAPLDADGIPTGALMTYINMLSKYVRQVQPDFMVVCWDGGKSAHRVAIDPLYKVERSIRPDVEEPDRPFAQAKEFLTLAGIHHVERPNVEADDLIAAYWRRKASTDRVFILSGDKDFLQLLDGWTEQIRPGAGLEERWTANRVRSDLGCRASDLASVMALTGDASDNVPGIHGFGAKTACKVLAKYDWDLDKAVAIDPKLLGQGDRVRRNYALVNLQADIPGTEVGPLPYFRPTTRISAAYHDLERYLLRYKLSAAQHRLTSGTLWGE